MRSAEEFVIDAVRVVRVTETTAYEDGTAADLVANARVEVAGTVEDAVLVADRVDFTPGDD